MALGSWLDRTERSRLKRLLRPGDRDLFATAQAALKSLVSDLVVVPAEEVRLNYACPLCDAPHGRPQVASPHAANCLDLSPSPIRGRESSLPHRASVRSESTSKPSRHLAATWPRQSSSLSTTQNVWLSMDCHWMSEKLGCWSAGYARKRY